ncbi:SLBB domain-containing protein [Gordonia jinghuaiqii]|uniref:SLBB domain-containing protein n=1 Tax=Gordonia jinghuaiqii TaxID=2758710 RepID=UPI002948BB11|nr:SLBB domain-containing protein [Gordonia jinghuaiqii]
MSASGRRNPLDRLGPVVEMPARRGEMSPASAQPDPPPEAADPDDFVGPVEEPEHPGWGIAGMPTWLDSPPPTRTPDPRERAGFLDDHPHDDDPLYDDDPIPRRRFAVAPPAAIALIAVGVIACVIAGFGLFGDSGSAPVVDFGSVAGSSAAPGMSVPPSTPPSAPGPTPTPTHMVVSVVGLVHKPGLVRLTPGARVAEAIDHAGGARKGADLLTLNLAQVLRDGDQILVGYAGGGQMSLRSAVVSAGGPGASGPRRPPVPPVPPGASRGVRRPPGVRMGS